MFSSRRRHTRLQGDWSSDVCSSDLEGCIARGYRYCAVTDHSYGLPIARGVSMSDLKKQHVEIDALNRRYRGRFRSEERRVGKEGRSRRFLPGAGKTMMRGDPSVTRK